MLALVAGEVFLLGLQTVLASAYLRTLVSVCLISFYKDSSQVGFGPTLKTSPFLMCSLQVVTV